ncbi:MAG: shikimate dehydrogenase [Flavobacteriales bacterium]|nr:shikimate dehydrogenase [Flavobacteriales bacterium]
MREYGLIGRNISYSFSEGYFSDKFKKLGISDCSYSTFDLSDISELKKLLKSKSDLKGFNITIPYKEEVIEFLDEIDESAKSIKAVNTVKIVDGKLIGYNTDTFGFRTSIKPFFEPQHRKALILGTGGAAKAIAFVLEQLGVSYLYVSRNPKSDNEVSYSELTKEAIANFPFIINCSPIGTFPNVDIAPEIPYEGIGDKHLLYDLVYNPKESLFLKKGKEMGAATVNGLSMLYHQAEEAWRIWNS